MSAVSLRERLSIIGEPRSGDRVTRLPGGFHSAPSSLRAAMHAMLPPRIQEWTNTHQWTFENLIWTEECQGLTTDGQSWFVSSNNEDLRAIHKFSLDFQSHLGEVQLPSGSGKHIGDIDCHAGRVYVAVDDPTARVWVLDTALNTMDVADLGGSPGAAGYFTGWCAVNPWNGYLYSSGGDGVDRVHAYDPTAKFSHVGTLHLQGPPLYGVQGGCFSGNGHLYLNSDRRVSPSGTKDIRAYSGLNGAFLGACPVDYDDSALEAEEMEGFAIAHIVHLGGGSTHIHVVVLDNDLTNPDDVFLKHFAVPDPDVL